MQDCVSALRIAAAIQKHEETYSQSTSSRAICVQRPFKRALCFCRLYYIAEKSNIAEEINIGRSGKTELAITDKYSEYADKHHHCKFF
ncbi:hypothetical protein TDB9533_02016 [Thalassocella blandensis]|nr:hypothetical protein TDB9533_02016 [Thalassocella blandensis]